MKKTIKYLLLCCITISALIFAASCSSDDSPFRDLNKKGYTVSVKYDANGGYFTTNTETILDTYGLDDYKTNTDGNKELKLFAPDATERGNQAYVAENSGYYLAGWYQTRTEVKDSEGNITGYTYSGKWDFDNDKLSVNADKTYSAETPVITLYAAWVPSLTYEFYSLDSAGGATLIGSVEKNPLASTEITLPSDNAASGRVGAANDFPALEGKTYGKVYLDAAKTAEITEKTITHSGKFIEESAAIQNPVMKIYCDVRDGAEYVITSPDQLIKSPDVNARYTIEADLDFTGKAWPAMFVTREFCGSINGNGHTIKNITVTQSTQSSCFGLFGEISASAEIKNLVFENVTVNIKGFSNQQNAAFGIFAGIIADNAKISSVTLKDSKLDLTEGLSLQVAVTQRAPKFGLVSAVGETSGITFSAENLKVTFSGKDSTTAYSFTPDEQGRFTLTAS